MSPLERDQIISPKALGFRVAHIIAMAQTLFGDDEKAKHWLSKSKDCFSGNSPIAMLSTTQGTRRVEKMLIQLAEGLAF
jgi:putative toxin-antitoxin system antitoxin component (TIGR02293 family)